MSPRDPTDPLPNTCQICRSSTGSSTARRGAGLPRTIARHGGQLFGRIDLNPGGFTPGAKPRCEMEKLMRGSSEIHLAVVILSNSGLGRNAPCRNGCLRYVFHGYVEWKRSCGFPLADTTLQAGSCVRHSSFRSGTRAGRSSVHSGSSNR